MAPRLRIGPWRQSKPMAVNRRQFLAGASVVPVSLGALGRTTEAPAADREPERRNVLFVTSDGLRWQDVFRGADPALLNAQDGKVADVEALRKAFWHDDPAERRRRLLPFLWSEVAAKGQLIGNRDLESRAHVSNGRNFSYPGYNEMLTGKPDPRIDSNDKNLNPNENVLEWLVRASGGAISAAGFGSWDLFPYILNGQRSGLHVNAGWQPIGGEDPTPRERLLDELSASIHRPFAEAVRLDALTLGVALEYIDRHRPQVIYLSLGETDDFAHEGRYDFYLEAARHFDESVARLWATVQSMPEYRGRTHLVLTTDHGRGEAPVDWRSHGASIAGSEAIWFGLLGPEVEPRGECHGPHEPLVQAQAAATVASLAGRPDYAARNPGTAPPIAYGPPAT